MRKKTKIIGLTGGIGSGKSTVLQFFKKLGCAVFIADVEAKNLMNTDPELRSQIIALFGNQAYTDGNLNRPWIADIVFEQSEKLRQLNALVHPKVRSRFRQKLSETAENILIYEAAILFESESDNLCDYVITVYSDEEVRIKRIMERDKLDRNQVLNRMANQLGDMEKIFKADFVIENNTLSHTEIKVKSVYNFLIKL